MAHLDAPPRAPAPRWWAGVADALGLAILVLVAATWISAGGPGDLAGGAAPALASVGRLAGLVSGGLMLVTLALVARLPLLERSFGQAELTHVHRLVARVAVALFALHVVAVLAGYAVRTGAGVLTTTWETVTTLPGLLAAVAGAGLCAAVAVTSWWRVRRRLRYETWHLTHVLAYLGAALLVPHMVWTGSSFAALPWARVAWLGLWGALGITVLVWRVVLPVLRSRRAGLRVAAGRHVGRGVWEVDVVGHTAALGATSGQFFYWRVHDGPGWTRAHPVSATATPDGGGLRLTVRVAGDGTARLAGARPGARLSVEGPYGRLTLDAAAPASPLAFLGAGVGVAPLVALAREAAVHGRDVVLISRAHDAESLVLREEVRALATRESAPVGTHGGRRHFPGGIDTAERPTAGVRVVEALGPRSTVAPAWPLALVGAVTPAVTAAQAGPGEGPGHGPHAGAPEAAPGAGASVLLGLVPDVTAREVFVCGPGEWTEAVARDLYDAGVPRARVHRERFSW